MAMIRHCLEDDARRKTKLLSFDKDVDRDDPMTLLPACIIQFWQLQRDRLVNEAVVGGQVTWYEF